MTSQLIPSHLHCLQEQPRDAREAMLAQLATYVRAGQLKIVRVDADMMMHTHATQEVDTADMRQYKHALTTALAPNKPRKMVFVMQ